MLSAALLHDELADGRGDALPFPRRALRGDGGEGFAGDSPTSGESCPDGLFVLRQDDVLNGFASDALNVKLPTRTPASLSLVPPLPPLPLLLLPHLLALFGKARGELSVEGEESLRSVECSRGSLVAVVCLW